MTELKNFTPHVIDIYNNGTRVFRLLSDGLARVKEETNIVDYLEVIPIVEKKYTEIEGLPPMEEGVYYIVSQLVAQAAKKIGRWDCLIPADLVRDENGVIIGCQSLAKV